MITDLASNRPELELAAHSILVIIPLIVPVLPIIISCVISVCVILKSLQISSNNPSSNPGYADKKQVTLTIIVVTIVYCTFNVPPVITVILYSIGYHDERIHKLFEFDEYYFYNNFQEIFCVGINAMVNPIVYYILIPSFKKHVKKIIISFPEQFKRVKHSVRSTQSTKL